MSHDSPTAGPVPPDSSAPEDPKKRMPAKHRDRFDEVAALLGPFGQKHLDPELNGFVIELWTRICRRKMPDCLRGKPPVWAASVVHVIARMNFLSDRAQPVHLTFDTICDFFKVSKGTVGARATEIERMFHFRPHSELGLCRPSFIEDFLTVRLSNGLEFSWKMAKKMGYLPPDAKVEDFTN